MALKTAYLIWDSISGKSCAGRVQMRCGDNARAMSIYPQYFGDTGDVTWIPVNAVGDEWTTKEGAMNGVAVSIGNNMYIYDIQADATSDEDENSPNAKLAQFLSYCCEDCDPNTVNVDGEYNGVTPDLPADTFCYTVTITDANEGSDESFPTAYDLGQVEMTVPEDYLASAVTFVSYNTGTNVLIVRFCLTQEVSTTGAPIGFPENWSFAEII